MEHQEFHIVLLKVFDENTAAGILHYLQKSCYFTKEFVVKCLPRDCCIHNVATEGVYATAGYVPFVGSALQSQGIEELVKETVGKGKRLN